MGQVIKFKERYKGTGYYPAILVMNAKCCFDSVPDDHIMQVFRMENQAYMFLEFINHKAMLGVNDNALRTY